MLAAKSAFMEDIFGKMTNFFAMNFVIMDIFVE